MEKKILKIKDGEITISGMMKQWLDEGYDDDLEPKNVPDEIVMTEEQKVGYERLLHGELDPSAHFVGAKGQSAYLFRGVPIVVDGAEKKMYLTVQLTIEIGSDIELENKISSMGYDVFWNEAVGGLHLIANKKLYDKKET